METTQIRATIREFILKNYLFTADGSALKDDVSLMQTGVIDSTGVLELILFLEEKFGVKVADEEMVPENLDSIVAISAFVVRRAA
jgi:acyl carrier protein